MNGITGDVPAPAATALYGMQRTTPCYGDITSPVPVAGQPGERVEARAFAIDIARMQFARDRSRPEVLVEHGNLFHVRPLGVGGGVRRSPPRKPDTAVGGMAGPERGALRLSERLSTLPAMLPSQRLEPGLPTFISDGLRDSGRPGGGRDVARRALLLDAARREARIEVPNVKPDDVRPSLEMARGNAVRPGN